MLPKLSFAIDVSWWIAGDDRLRAVKWGWIINPLASQIIAGKPDGAVNAQGPALEVTRAA
jgi:hypothetical protein